jgi:hypothetical protein
MPPIETIIGTGHGWAQEVFGPVHIKPVAGRTTLHIQGPGGMKINGPLTIGA